MIRLPLFLMLLLLNSFVKSQTLNVRVNSGQPNSKLQIDVPINGLQTKGLNRQYYTIDSNQVDIIRFNSQKDGVFKFFVSGVGFELILFPNDSLSININIEEKKFTINLTGSNEDGHRLWLEMDRPKPKKFLMIRDSLVKEKYLENIYEIVVRQADSLSNQFLGLYKDGLVTYDYYKAVTHYIKDDLGGCFFEYIEHRYNNDWDRLEPYFKKYLIYMDSYNPKLIHYSYWSIDWYYANKYRSETAESDYHRYLGIYGYYNYLPKSLVEWKTSFIIALSASTGSSEINWKDAYNYFIKNYPNSAFKPYLDSFIQPFMNKGVIPTDGIIFFDSDKDYNTLNELVSKEFKDKYVFIDLWATWCAPCRTEFQFSVQLHDFLTKHGVVVLYISIDKDRMAGAWRKTVENTQLKGFHIRTQNDLYYNIWELFYGEGQISIPRYIFVGKDGNILDDNLPRPSSLDILQNRILKLIK